MIAGRVKNFVQKHKKIVWAILFIAAFILVLFLTYLRGVQNPIRDSSADIKKPPEVLESAFLRWVRGENGELFASFRLQNHTKKYIGSINIQCASFLADDRLLESYDQKINVSLSAGEVRMLNRTYIGALDPLAQKVNCRVESWE